MARIMTITVLEHDDTDDDPPYLVTTEWHSTIHSLDAPVLLADSTFYSTHDTLGQALTAIADDLKEHV